MKKNIFVLGMLLFIFVTSCSKEKYSSDKYEYLNSIEENSENGIVKETDDKKNNHESYTYISKIVEKPEDIPYVESISCILDKFRLSIFDVVSGERKVWDSKNNGVTWELNNNVNSMIKDLDVQMKFKFSDEENIYTWDYNRGVVNIQGEEFIVCEEDEILLDASFTNDIITVLIQDSLGKNHIFQYNSNTREKKEIYSDDLNEQISGRNCITTNMSAGIIYLAGNDIIKYDIESNKVNIMVKNSDLESVKSNATKTITEINVLENENILLKVREMESQSDKLYYLSRESETEVDDVELYIYSLKENAQLRQIIALYKEMNPEVEIKYEFGYTGEDGIIISDAIRNLNTKILAGQGPDVIMLDDLPIEQYIEKGILEDITDILEYEKEQLFDNIIYKYNKNENIYAIPTTFFIPIIVGDKNIVQSKNTDELIEKINVLNKEEKVLASENFPSIVMNLWYTTDILDKENNYEELKKFLLDLKELFDISMTELNKEQLNEYYSLKNLVNLYPQVYTDIALSIYFDEAQIGITVLNNPDVLAEIDSLCKEKNLCYANLNSESGNSYFASDILGINSKSNMKDVAKSFVEYYLMEGIKNIDTSGFPVNKLAFEKSMPISNSKEIYNTYYKTQNFEKGLNVYNFTQEDLVKIDSFISNLNKPIQNDEIIDELIIEQAEKYLYEGSKLDNVISEVSEKLNLYMKE